MSALEKTMADKILIVAGRREFRAVLNDTATARAIVQGLPFEVRANRWGGEVYFSVPVEADLESDAREILEPGELGYWPPGNAFCIFFGRTPASQGDEPRAASPVNVFGRIEGHLADLWSIADGATIVVRMLSEREV
jgi:hypothetical protein